MKLTPLNECVKGMVYRLNCRNLKYGVFDGKDGFIGIRTKFGQRYLFTEYHWEQGPPFGTVKGAEPVKQLHERVCICEQSNMLFSRLNEIENG